MEKKKEKEFVVCLRCSKNIDVQKDKFVLLGTYNSINIPKNEKFFHFNCWVDYFNQCVINKARANVSLMQKQAVEIFNSPVIKNMLSQIQGSDQALKMLKTPLKENTLTFIEITDPNKIEKLKKEIKEKIKEKDVKTKKGKKGKSKIAEMQ